MYYKKISISRFERFFTAICIAISAINLIVSFLVAGYWYGKSTVIPYSVLVICNFILLEFVLYSVINGMSDIGSQLDRKSKKSRKDVQEKAVTPVTIAPKVIEPATTVPTPVEVIHDNPAPVKSEQITPVSEKTAEDCHASEPISPALQPSVERDEKVMEIISRSTQENEEKRKQFIEKRKELMKEYILWAVAPLLDEADARALWLEYEQWIESSTYHPIGRMWRWKEKVTSRDVRHLTWNIAKRLGMDLGYSTKTCGRFIKTMFPDLCIKRDRSQCTEEYLANNLLEEKDTDFIKIDKPDPHSIAFHFRDGQMKQAV
jgi:hypothetical protein